MSTVRRFTSPAIVGVTVTGVSECTVGLRRRPYSTGWSGVYEGVRPSEWTGAPVHFFRDGVIGETPQRCFAFPVSQFKGAAMTSAEYDYLRCDDPDSRWAAVTLAELRDGTLAGKPHLILACGHLSPRGDGPLAEAGYGYCSEHGVSRVVAENPAP